MNISKCLISAFLVGAMNVAAFAQTATQTPSADEILKKLASYKTGENWEAASPTEELVRESLKDEKAKAALARKLADMLGSADVTVDAKKFICRQLRIIAGLPEVPVLAALLTDKDLADMARFAMENVRDASVGRAMLAALARATPAQKVGLVNSLANRGEVAAVDELAKLTSDNDKMVARSAIWALARIATPESAAALEKAQPATDDKLKAVFARAHLLCADLLLEKQDTKEAHRIYRQYAASTQPSYRGHAGRGELSTLSEKDRLAKILELLAGQDWALQQMAADEARRWAADGVGKALAEAMPRLSAYAQVLVLGVLADRRETAALPAVVQAAGSKDDFVVIAAMAALGQVGDASVVPLLTAEARTADLRKIEDLQPQEPLGGAMVSIVPLVDFSRGNAARSSLIALKDKNVDSAILKVYEQADTATRSVLADVLAARLAEEAVAPLLKAGQDKDAVVRNSAIKALGPLAGQKDLPRLVGFYLQAASDSDRATAEKALLLGCRRIGDREQRADCIQAVYDSASTAEKALLLTLLGQITSTKSLERLRAALQDKDEDIYAAAVRGMAGWRDMAAAGDLLKLATDARTETFRILALRGYIRLCAQGPSEAEMAAMFANAAKLVTRKEEKLLMFSGMQNSTNSTAAVKVIAPYLADTEVKQEAARAAVSVGDRVKEKDLSELKAIIRKLPSDIKDPWVLGRAESILKR